MPANWLDTLARGVPSHEPLLAMSEDELREESYARYRRMLETPLSTRKERDECYERCLRVQYACTMRGLTLLWKEERDRAALDHRAEEQASRERGRETPCKKN